MHEKRPPPNGRPVAEHPSLARYRDGRFRCGAATVAAEVIEQVAARIRLASIVADRELVGRYAAALLVEESAPRNLLTDATPPRSPRPRSPSGYPATCSSCSPD